MMKYRKFLVFLIILLFTGCVKTPNKQESFNLEIIHLNDTHSHIEPTKIKIKINNKNTYVFAGGYAKIANFIIHKKKSNTLVLHAGDALQGSLYYMLFKGKADIEILNKMRLDAFTIGNHEFDNGAYEFAKNFVMKADFPILACDINAKKNKYLKNIIQPFIIKKINGEKVAIVGDTINSSVISKPGKSVLFNNYLLSAMKSVEKLKKMGINKIIFLTHLGIEKDKILAKKIPDIDVIVGGHSHTLLGDFSNLGLQSYGKYPMVIEHNKTKTLIVTAWKWGLVVGDLNVSFNKKGEIVSFNGTPVMLVDNRFLRKISDKKVEIKSPSIYKYIKKAQNIKIETNNNKIEEIIKKYKPKIDILMNKVIAKSKTDLSNQRVPNHRSFSAVAQYVAFAFYNKTKNLTDFALINAGDIRGEIPQGNITLGQIYNILPFKNSLVILEIKGKILKTTLQNAVSRAMKGNSGAFPYLANAEMKIKNSKIVELKINGKPIKDEKIYKFVTISYIANGGDYYKEFKNLKKEDTGFIEDEVFIEFIKNKTLKPIKSSVLVY
ncbi:bifunctional metallophosphatase/5'-nucleotidase [Nautilia lithotrophica]